MKLSLAALSVGLLTAFPGSAQELQHLLDPGLRDLLHEELSGELAKEHVIEITRHHRIQGSRGYRDSAQYVLDQLRAYGFDEEHAWIESFPSDGRTEYQGWQSPSGWDIESAELRMVEPRDELIVAYPEIAMSVVTYSNAGQATAELVFVGAGTSAADYAGKDVAGKFVLATGYGGAVHRQAVLEHGAVGVVCYLDDERAEEYPDMLAYTGMWPKADELERITFGFNLTNRQGEKLRRLLAAGERVVLDGNVRGRGLEPFFMDVVVARIPGVVQRDEEVVFSAHLDHPKESANDNASGSAALLDIARSLRTLIDEGRLKDPGRSLRFLWVPEWYGTMAYIDAHPELMGPSLGGKVLANVNLDMVGENLELLHCRLEVTRVPESLPTAFDDVVADMAAMVDEMDVRTPRGSLSAFNYRVTPYAGGSDHMMFIDRKVPGVMLWHSPDYTHHTSEDTPDKVDPAQLERCELIATGALWYVANLSREQAADLAWLAMTEAVRKLNAQTRRGLQWMADATDEDLPAAWNEADQALRLTMHQERFAMQSVLSFHADDELRLTVSELEHSLRRMSAAHRKRLLEEVQRRLGEAPAMTDPIPPEEIDARIPVRTTRGPLAFDLPESRLPAERAAWYASPEFPFSADERYELVNFVDGKRSVTSLRHLLSGEFGPAAHADVVRYVEDLVEIGALKWFE